MKRLSQLIAEEKGEKAHKEAIAMGLKYGGFGYWKDANGVTKYKTENDTLVPVEPEQEAELAGKGGSDEGGGLPGGPGLASQEKAFGPRGATQKPRGPEAEPGRNIGSAEPGAEQAPKRMNWVPGPDGDNCVGKDHPPGDIPDDAFVGKTNYYQWTSGPDGTNFTNVSYDNIIDAAKKSKDDEERLAQAPPQVEDVIPFVDMVKKQEVIQENAEANYKRDVAKLIAKIKKMKERKKAETGDAKKRPLLKILDQDD